MTVNEAFEISFLANEIKSVISTTAEVTPEIEKYLNELLDRISSVSSAK